MKNLLRKLHFVPDQSDPSPSKPPAAAADQHDKPLLGLPAWLTAVSGRNSSPNSNPSSSPPPTTVAPTPSSSGSSSSSSTFSVPSSLEAVREGDSGAAGAVARRPMDSVLDDDDEEYQLRLALELSAREDPEAVQIEAVKQISLGSLPSQNTPAEVVAYRYWNYNALGYDDKIMDGFYDLYGILAESATVKMPSLVDLQEAPVSDGVCWEAILVNRAGDPDLLKLEEKALVMALNSSSGSLCYGGNNLLQKLAVLVSDSMGGPVDDNYYMLNAWRSHTNNLRVSIGSNVLPLGLLRVGLARHRALLFKVLADSLGIPCQLVKGKPHTGLEDGAMNIVKISEGREYMVDLMADPGTLIPSDAAGTLKEPSANFFPLSPSLGDIENVYMTSCTSGTSSSLSCSFGNEIPDERSRFDPSDTSGSEVGDTHGELKTKQNLAARKSSTDIQNVHSKVSKDPETAWNNQVVPTKEVNLRQNNPYALARSPSWTEGLNSSGVRRMKVKDVSQYMIDATKENPQLAQKLHDVLLESGVMVPPNLFAEISTQQESTIFEGRSSSDHQNESELVETSRSNKSKAGSNVGSTSFPDNLLTPKLIPSTSQVEPDHLKPVIGMGVKHPLSIGESSLVPCSSQVEASPAQSQASQIKIVDNMPVSAAVATAAIFASSMIVAVAKSSTVSNAETAAAATATAAAAAAAVAATTAVSIQQEQLHSCAPMPVMSHYSTASANRKGEEPPVNEQKGSSSGKDGVPRRELETGEHHHETERSSNRPTETGSEKSDVSLEEVAEFEIPWEEISLGERIGLGSYGEVYRGDWNGTEVAVKKFLDQDISGVALEEFRSEVRIMKRLRHPNVVLFMGAITRVPNLSIVTEFLPRGSLFRLIHRPNNQLDERRRMKMALDIARGMNYLHNCSPAIVHRDLKSPNLLVDKNWIVKVCDFGLSRMKHNTFLSSRSTAGTAEWMAPEVLRNEPSDEKCDVYSFGVILWELCTLQQPWGGMNAMQVVGAVGFQHRRLDIPEDMDPAISDIIMKCWQTDPMKRPSFSEIMAQLRLLQRPASNNIARRQRITQV